MKVLNNEDSEALFCKYLNDRIFQSFMPLISALERNAGELDAVTIWYYTDKIITKLRCETEYREMHIDRIYNKLISDCNILEYASGKKAEQETRDEKQAKNTAILIMFVLRIRLMNSAPKGGEKEKYTNKPIVNAITRILRNEKTFVYLLNAYYSHKTDDSGNKYVFTPEDPFIKENNIDDLDNTSKEEARKLYNWVIDYTKKLKANESFKTEYDKFKELWKKIVADDELIILLKEKKPNSKSNTYGRNIKMICNVIGIFIEKRNIGCDISAVNNCISGTNFRSYIRNFVPKDNSSDSAFNKEQYSRICCLIETL